MRAVAVGAATRAAASACAERERADEKDDDGGDEHARDRRVRSSRRRMDAQRVFDRRDAGVDGIVGASGSKQRPHAVVEDPPRRFIGQ
jgi:hypothetical protein